MCESTNEVNVTVVHVEDEISAEVERYMDVLAEIEDRAGTSPAAYAHLVRQVDRWSDILDEMDVASREMRNTLLRQYRAANDALRQELARPELRLIPGDGEF